MNELEEKCLRFVLRHYQKNKLDTRQALKVFKEKHGVVGRAGGKNRYFLFLSGLAAAILLAFIVWVGISPEKQWTELAAYEHAVKYQCRTVRSLRYIPILLFVSVQRIMQMYVVK